MTPALQVAPGYYDTDQLEGLDFLLAAMAERDMTGVVCLGNMWQWSGGFAAYVQWDAQASAQGIAELAAPAAIPYPGHSSDPAAWARLQSYAARFYTRERAVQWYLDHVRRIVCRRNHVSGVLYRDDPTILSWQLANEPRGWDQGASYFEWVRRATQSIRALDPNHLISIGSEGHTPWPHAVNNAFEQVHALASVDYLTFHLWLQNWNWFRPGGGPAELDLALEQRAWPYLSEHQKAASALGKPIVLEEFGLCRDGGDFAVTASCSLRDRYYAEVLDRVAREVEHGGPLAGVNFWAWSGEGRPREPGADHCAGDPYTGDPPHEPQGWYGVYDRDASTAAVLLRYAPRINSGR